MKPIKAINVFVLIKKALFSQNLTDTMQDVDYLDYSLIYSSVSLDFKITEIFVSKQGKTAVFSPLSFDYNFHLQMITKEFRDKLNRIAITRLGHIDMPVSEIMPGKIKFFNEAYFPNSINSICTKDDAKYKMCIYKSSDLSNVFQQHNSSINTFFEESLLTPISEKYFQKELRIFNSMSYVKKYWFNNQDVFSSSEKLFTKGNDSQEHRKFFKVVKSCHHKRFVHNQKIYSIVAIPDPKAHMHADAKKSYLIYLVPMNFNVSFSEIWAGFRSVCNDDISMWIKRTDCSICELEIPYIPDMSSVYDLHDLAPEFFTWQRSSNIVAKLKTYLNVYKENIVDEENTSLEPTISLQKHIKTKIILNLPYIGLVYDDKIGRILSVFIDNGEV